MEPRMLLNPGFHPGMFVCPIVVDNQMEIQFGWSFCVDVRKVAGLDIRQNLKSRLVFLIRNRCNFFIGDALQICKIFRADPTCFYKVSPSLTYIKMACLFQNIGWRMPNHHLIVNELDMYAYA